MSLDTWRAAVAADRPALTAAQLSALRPLGQLMAAHLAQRTAPAETRAALHRTADTKGVTR